MYKRFFPLEELLGVFLIRFRLSCTTPLAILTLCSWSSLRIRIYQVWWVDIPHGQWLMRPRSSRARFLLPASLPLLFSLLHTAHAASYNARNNALPALCTPCCYTQNLSSCWCSLCLAWWWGFLYRRLKHVIEWRSICMYVCVCLCVCVNFLAWNETFMGTSNY